MIDIRPQDRIGGPHEPRRPVFLYICLGLLAVIVGGAAVFYPQVIDVWHRLTAGRSQETLAAYEKLGVPTLPPHIALNPDVHASFDQLRREPCDRTAILTFTRAIGNLGYRREAANGLVRFGSNCGHGEDAFYEAGNWLMGLSDFEGALKLADGLVEAVPASPDVRLLRGLALEGLGRREQALPDYFSTIQLVGDIKGVSSLPFEKISNIYASLQRYCEAITPLQIWVSVDPASRDTSQVKALIADYVRKGRCDLEYAKGSDRFPVSSADVIKVQAQVNSTPGTFIVDTGASLVSLIGDFSRRAQVTTDERNRMTLQTANGTTEGVLGVARKVQVGRVQAADVAVVVVSGSFKGFGSGVDGLLGMSFLARYDVTFAGREWRLKEKSSP